MLICLFILCAFPVISRDATSFVWQLAQGNTKATNGTMLGMMHINKACCGMYLHVDEALFRTMDTLVIVGVAVQD